MRKQIKKYGYVIEMKRTSSDYPGFYSGGLPYARPLQFAIVYNREAAREVRFRDETVRKVELSTDGKPKRVVTR